MKNELFLCVLHRGWIMVGNVSEKSGKVTLKNASVVRKWGTTDGLPELANKGPQSNTKLDGKCEMEFPIGAVIAKLKCNSKAWKNY